MKNLAIALRMLRRNAHSGEARVLAAALFVAVAPTACRAPSTARPTSSSAETSS